MQLFAHCWSHLDEGPRTATRSRTRSDGPATRQVTLASAEWSYPVVASTRFLTTGRAQVSARKLAPPWPNRYPDQLSPHEQSPVSYQMYRQLRTESTIVMPGMARHLTESEVSWGGTVSTMSEEVAYPHPRPYGIRRLHLATVSR